MLVEHFANKPNLISIWLISQSCRISRALEWKCMCTSAQGINAAHTARLWEGHLVLFMSQADKSPWTQLEVMTEALCANAVIPGACLWEPAGSSSSNRWAMDWKDLSPAPSQLRPRCSSDCSRGKAVLSLSHPHLMEPEPGREGAHRAYAPFYWSPKGVSLDTGPAPPYPSAV